MPGAINDGSEHFFVVYRDPNLEEEMRLRPAVYWLEHGRLWVKRADWADFMVGGLPCASHERAREEIIKHFSPQRVDFVAAAMRREERHPLMARNVFPPESALALRRCADELDYLRATAPLWEELEKIFRFIEPVERNMGVFGFELRRLLIAACTEVEAAWTQILRRNGYPGDRWSTNDYVALLEPMRLNEYSIRFSTWSLGEFRPFEHWNAAAPTRSLHWYDAYNRTKHDRVHNLELASLRNILDAMTAVAVMGIAQFGYQPEVPYAGPSMLQYRECSVPSWSVPDLYIGHPGGPWTMVPMFGRLEAALPVLHGV